MVATKDWKQSDIAEKFSLNSVDIKAYRDEFLVHGTHWSKSGATIYWTDHAMWMLRKHLEDKDKSIEIPDEIEVTVIALANNPRFVYGNLDGSKIAISCRANNAASLLRKTIKVIVTEENGEIYYSHKL